MDLDEKRRLLGNWRGRRLLACWATDLLRDVITALANDDGSHLPPDGGMPTPPSAAHIREMENQATALMRTILLWNDGAVSPHSLRSF
jgi:hypothetical protein